MGNAKTIAQLMERQDQARSQSQLHHHPKSSVKSIPVYSEPETLEGHAEHAIIATLLKDKSALGSLVEIDEKDFISPVMREIFSAIKSLYQQGKDIDPFVIAEYMKEEAYVPFLGEVIMNSSHSSANITYYLSRLRDAAARQKISEIGRAVVEQAASIDNDVSSVSEEAVRQILDISRQSQRYTPKRIENLLTNYFAELEARSEGSSSLIPTDLEALDVALGGGTGDGDLIVVGARPAMGKTSFALRVAQNIAKRTSKNEAGEEVPNGVLVFSMEMPINQVIDRGIAIEGRCDVKKLRNGSVLTDDEQMTRFVAGSSKYAHLPIYIDEQPAMTLFDVVTKARAIHQQHGIRAIVIDYLQLMRGSDPKKSRNEQLNEITAGLKALAKDLKVRIILLSQLNRELEKRPNKRPIMSDLRESGGIEQDADIIIMLYRDEVYNPDTDQKGMAEAIIVKARNGSTSTVYLMFDAPSACFDDLPNSRYDY